MAQLTLRIYKDEIDGNRLNFIRRTFTVFEESEKVLSVEGSEEDIVKLYDNYLLSDEQFKQAFPDYMTRAERAVYTNDKVEEVKSYVQNALLDIIAKGELNAEYEMLRRLYLEHLK